MDAQKTTPIGSQFAQTTDDSKNSDAQTEKSTGQAVSGTENGAQSDSNSASHIKEQIRANQDALNSMSTVTDIYVPFESVKDKQQIRDWAVKILESSGYKATNAELGTVVFDKKRINGAVKYLKTPTEFAAFAALPKVIEKGSVLASHENYKGRNYGTYTIIAPVEINGQRGNMAVVVRKTSDNFYKVHRVLSPDGNVLNVFDIKNTDIRNAGGYTENNDAHAQRTMSVSTENISQNSDIVNTPNRRYSEQNSEYSAEYQKGAEHPNTVGGMESKPGSYYAEMNRTGKQPDKSITEHRYSDYDAFLEDPNQIVYAAEKKALERKVNNEYKGERAVLCRGGN